MSVVDFTLPDLGEGLEDGEIVSWQVEVGDVVELNQVLCEVETAKAVVEVPSPFAGRIVERNGDVGATLAVGELLVRIDRAGGSTGASESTGSPGTPDDVTRPTSTGLDADEEPPNLVGYGQREPTGGRRRRRSATDSSGNGEARQSDIQVRTKPPVRKLARELGVDLTAIAPGSGPGGVITRADVLAASPGSTDTSAVRAPQHPPSTLRATGGTLDPDGFRGRRPGEIEEVHGIRRRIIEKMEVSRRDIPEATCSRTADLTALWDLRTALNAQAEESGLAITVTPFAYILRATVIALRRFPTLNASIDRDAGRITLHEHINLGFAVDTDRGLIVPNIKSAEDLGILELADQVARLSQAARDGSIGPADLTGGTFTVSNYGAFGNDDGNPIINHPEAGILGVGAIRPRPWVVDGDVVARRTCTFTLAFDHRVSDGGEAGRFVTYVADLCERPGLVLLDPSG